MNERTKTAGLGVALMLLCTLCLCIGQFIWKRYDGILPLLLGFGIYAAGALAMLAAYRFGSLSVLQPINSLSYVVSVILGGVFFQEAITPLRIAGIVLIMAGVFVLVGGERNTE